MIGFSIFFKLNFFVAGWGIAYRSKYGDLWWSRWWSKGRNSCAM